MPHTCVFGCRATDVVMHVFPNPNKFPERFKSWVSLVGGDLQMLTDSEIYEKKRICDIHFSDNHRNRFKRLSVLAIPSLHLPHTSTGQHADPGNHDQLNVYHVATSSIESSRAQRAEHASQIPSVLSSAASIGLGQLSNLLAEHNYSAASLRLKISPLYIMILVHNHCNFKK
ncbi:hypothetical protein ACJJTC_004658 [Scirpophaga incertulas]